jgi:hypothetical protein
LRVVLEERLTPNVEYDVLVGETTTVRKVSVAWSQEKTDGQIVGLKYLDEESSVPPPEASTPPGKE